MHILVFTFILGGLEYKDVGTDVCKHATYFELFLISCFNAKFVLKTRDVKLFDMNYTGQLRFFCEC
jgi:hypothetical protein